MPMMDCFVSLPIEVQNEINLNAKILASFLDL
jgi:hypothetical protein